jgi:hypothetical protein
LCLGKGRILTLPVRAGTPALRKECR